MKFIRHVPLSSGLTAAAEATSIPARDDPANRAFHEWYNAPRFGHRSVLDRASVTVEQVQELLADVPLTPVGVAWKEATEVSLMLTLSDIDRPYDEASYEEAEMVLIKELYDFAETLRDFSPLLVDVASVIEAQAMNAPFDIDDLRKERESITSEGVVLGAQGYCDKHDDDCYGDNRRVATWAHLNAIFPGIENTVTGLLTRLDAGIPEVGDDDNGRARHAHRHD